MADENSWFPPPEPERPPPQDAPAPWRWPARTKTAEPITPSERDPVFNWAQWRAAQLPDIQKLGEETAHWDWRTQARPPGPETAKLDESMVGGGPIGLGAPGGFAGILRNLPAKATPQTPPSGEVVVPPAAVEGWWGAASRQAPGLSNYETKLAEEHGIPPSEALDWWKAGGPKPPSPPSPTRFTTAKGSTYTVHPDGTTSRIKAERPEHPGEVGPQPRSMRTWYVTKDDADKLSEITARGAAKRQLAELPDGRVGVKYLEGKDAGKFEGRTVVRPSPTPQPGLHPVEIWADGSVHFGNAITEIQ